MKVKVVVTSDNAHDAYVKGIKSNDERKSNNPVDRAFQMKELRENHGWSDKDLVAFFNTNQSFVSIAKKLVTLNESVLKMLATGEITIDTAYRLAGLEEKTQDEILAKLKAEEEAFKAKQLEALEERAKDAAEIDKGLAEGGTQEPAKKKKPSNAQPPKGPDKNRTIKEEIAKKKEAANEKNKTAPPAANGKKPKVEKLPPPTFKQVKEAIETEFINIKNAPEPLFVIASMMMEYMTGKISQDKMGKDCRAESRKYDLRPPEKK
jgi:transcriptional regulator with XRE-family HTH domain